VVNYKIHTLLLQIQGLNMKQVKPKETSSTQLQECIDRCITQGPQLLKRNSKPVAVLVSFKEWQIILRNQQESLKELLLSDDNRGEIVIPQRGRCLTRRSINSI
jgi:PHD/YefM family antitoxin component YafN of YafNO toxin-antitoxin module